MLRSIRHIIAISLLTVFLLPSVIKTEHHHEHFVCHHGGETHLHEYHEKCLVCKFEFSLYTTRVCEDQDAHHEYSDSYANNYCTEAYQSHPEFDYSLRAPPC
jgi:hypothetical protein